MFNKGYFSGTYFTGVYFAPVITHGGKGYFGRNEKSLEQKQAELEQEIAGTETVTTEDLSSAVGSPGQPSTTVEEITANLDNGEQQLTENLKDIEFTPQPDIALMLAIIEATEY